MDQICWDVDNLPGKLRGAGDPKGICLKPRLSEDLDYWLKDVVT